METPSCIVPLEAQPLDCCVSPASGLLAAALVTGQLQLVTFSCAPNSSSTATTTSSQLEYQLRHTLPAPAAPSRKPAATKTKSSTAAEAPTCRAVCFTHDGAAVLAGYSDNAVRSYDAATGALAATFSGEHDQQLSRVLALEPHVFVSGDEEGLVALWDDRVNGSSGSGACYRYTQHTDYITDFAMQSHQQALVATSGDATLSVHDLRKRKALARSEDDGDDELLSCAVVKGGRKVVAGCQSGVLALYSWGYWNDCSDRFPGHPESVQALVAFDDDTLLTGSSDGGVRVVGVLPNRLLGILGQHNEDFPVERLALSHDRRVLASTSHDSAVKLWDLSLLLDDDGEEEEGQGEEEENGVGVEGRGGGQGAGKGGRAGKGEEEGEGEEEEEDGSKGEGGSSDEDSSSDWDSDEEDGEEGGSSGSGEDEGEEEKAGARGTSPGLARAAASIAAVTAAGRKGGKVAGKATIAVGDLQAPAVGGGGTNAGGGKATAPSAAAAASGPRLGKEFAKKDSDGDSERDDDDSDGGGPKRKRAKRERTKWTQGTEQKKQPAANFFADLL